MIGSRNKIVPIAHGETDNNGFTNQRKRQRNPIIQRTDTDQNYKVWRYGRRPITRDHKTGIPASLLT